MTRFTFQFSLVAVGLLAAVAIVGGVWAATTPTQADMDYCNQQAAAGLPSRGTGPNSPTDGASTTPLRPGEMGQTRGNMGQSAQPGNNPTGSNYPSTGSNAPSAGSNNPSTGSPGVSGSQSTAEAPGMASLGNSDPRYRQMYVSCLQQRGQ